jgi:GT2 family glycosyltransferase
MNKKPTVTVSLLTWNGAEYLPWLLKSLKEQTFKNWQLLVLDNASADRSREVVREYYPQARIISQKQNIGFARGHNLLINWSDSDYILVLNQDVVLEKDYLQKIITWLAKNPKVASAAGKILYWDFKTGARTDQIDSFGLRVNRRRQMFDAYQGTKDFVLENQEVFGLSGAAVVFRRSALETVGFTHLDNYHEYFDDDYFAYKEDVDLAWRLRLAGWQNWLITSARAYHHRTVAGLKGLRERRKDHHLANKFSYRNHLATIYKDSFAKHILKDWWPWSWYEFKKFMYLLLLERSTLAGLWEFYKLLPTLTKKRKFIKKNIQVSPEDIYKWFV